MKTKDAEPVVPCSHCAGEGWIVLTGVYADTLTLLKKQKKELSGVELAGIAKVNPTAMNNRLVALEGYGLATGRRYGRYRLWKNSVTVITNRKRKHECEAVPKMRRVSDSHERGKFS